jgi:hypothetical protein
MTGVKTKTQYKSMRQLFIYSIFTCCLLIFSCQNRLQDSYANDFGKCLDKNDKELINQMTVHFDLLLKEYYPNTEISLAYQKYLEAISKMEIPLNFFLNSETLSLVNSTKGTNTFSKIWIIPEIETEQISDSKSEQIVIINKNKTQPEPHFESFTINPNGDFLNCLLNKTENKDFKEILKTKKEIPDISNGLVASALHSSLKKDDYENGLIRTFIAINLYFEFTLNLEKLKISR